MTIDEPSPGACERAGLLLSLAADGAATPSQRAEIDAHLPRCEACRRALRTDAAVKARLLERADAPAPAWLPGFAQRTVARAVAQARDARTQNRLLWMSAAAAMLVAVTAQFALPGGALSQRSSNETETARDSARRALVSSYVRARAEEGK